VDVLIAGDTAIGRLDAVLHRVDQLLARDLLLGVELEEGTDEIATHGASSLLLKFHGADKKKRGGHPRHGAAVQFAREYTPPSVALSTEGVPDSQPAATSDVDAGYRRST
jgi:hypothetical protein